MCQRTGIPPLLVCTIGDLVPGTQYHDPNGETWMVLSLPRSADSTMVVNVGNGAGNRFGNALRGDEFKGRVTPVYNDVKLGYDERGRLYSSTFLNGWQYPADDDDGINLGIALQPPRAQSDDDEDGCDLSWDPTAPQSQPKDDEWVDLGGES